MWSLSLVIQDIVLPSTRPSDIVPKTQQQIVITYSATHEIETQLNAIKSICSLLVNSDVEVSSITLKRVSNENITKN